MLEVVGLQGSRNERVLFSKITFKLNAGQWLWVKGKNGQGKTTLLKMLAGLLMQDCGRIHWNGQKSRFDPVFLQNMIYLGHVPALNPLLSFLENLKWAQMLRNNSNVANNLSIPNNPSIGNNSKFKDLKNDNLTNDDLTNDDLFTEIAELCLSEIQDTPCEQLSFGQKQRAVLLKLKLFEQTRLWILDEPATGLDLSAKNWLLLRLQKHLRSGGIAVIASHDQFELRTLPHIIDLNNDHTHP